MKKCILILITFCATSLLFAKYNFHSSLTPPEGTRGMAKFSQLKWVDSAGPIGTANPISGVPGKADDITLRSYKIEIDRDITAANLCINGDVVAENKKFNLRGISSHMGPKQSDVSELELKNCNLNVSRGIMSHTLNTVGARECGMAVFKFVDTTAKFTGMYELSLLNSNITNTVPGGMTLILEGKSRLEFVGVMIDSYLKNNPTKMTSIFEFAENKGNVPEIIFNGAVNDVARSVIKVRITPNAKVGKFPLITFASKGDVMSGNFAEVIINGKKVGFDEFREAGNFRAKVVKGVSPSGRDKSSENDIVLIIEKNN